MKIKNKDILIFYKAEKYKNLYAKTKLVEWNVTSKEKIFLQNFEENSSLSEIMSLRNLAMDTIAVMKSKLNDDSEKNKKQAKEYFDQYKIENPYDLLGDLNLNLIKKEEKPFKLQISVEIQRLDILIQENEMLKSLKNLHNYVTVFSEALEEKKDLKDKILNHIKENFVQEISNQQRFAHNAVIIDQEISKKSSPFASSEKKKSEYDNKDEANLGIFFNKSADKVKKKMLLQIIIEEPKIHYEVDFLFILWFFDNL